MQKFVCLLAVLFLSACGFHLRGQVELPKNLKYVYLEGASPVLREQFRKTLQASSSKLLDNPENAGLMIKIVSEANNQRSLSLSATGRSNEFELYYRIDYQLASTKAENLEPQPVLEIKRQYYNNQQDILAKSNEEQVIRSEMTQQAVQTIVNRVYAWSENKSH